MELLKENMCQKVTIVHEQTLYAKRLVDEFQMAAANTICIEDVIGLPEPKHNGSMELVISRIYKDRQNLIFKIAKMIFKLNCRLRKTVLLIVNFTAARLFFEAIARSTMSVPGLVQFIGQL